MSDTKKITLTDRDVRRTIAISMYSSGDITMSQYIALDTSLITFEYNPSTLQITASLTINTNEQ